MINQILDKYSESTLKGIEKTNMRKIIVFLIENDCDYIEDILEDYLDLFTFDYDEFVEKFHKLNSKYHNHFLELASEDMNYLEEFYTI